MKSIAITAVKTIAAAIIIIELCVLCGIALESRAEEYIAVIYQDVEYKDGIPVITIPEGPPINRVSESLVEIERRVYAGITVTEEENRLLQAIIWAEANNQSFDGQKAVLEVIFNRLRSPEWPDTIVGVLSQRGQFATWKYRDKVHPDPVQAEVIESVLQETSTVLPSTSYVYFDTRGRNGKNKIKLQDHWFGEGR